MAKTTLKRPGKKGKSEITPADGVRFTSDNQPSGEAKSLGKKKKKMLRDLLELAYQGPARGKARQLAATYLGVDESELTVENMMHFKQIESAIKKGNTFAYVAVLDRVYGKPKQPLVGGGEDDGPIRIGYGKEE